uniref:Uncharacterized protein n=1 Tax=Romanomermis culicivorax TaxID=13658 RepID=A0A915IBV3_ROMCU
MFHSEYQCKEVETVCRLSNTVIQNLQFVNQGHFVVVFESVVQMQKTRVPQKLAHNVHFVANHFFVGGVWRRHEFGGENVTGRFFHHAMNGAESATEKGR